MITGKDANGTRQNPLSRRLESRSETLPSADEVDIIGFSPMAALRGRCSWVLAVR
jgi:hypothetical protein